MQYTVRFTHLDFLPTLKIGDKIITGDLIGVMGNSGASSAIHLHIDCVKGWHKRVYTLKEIESGKYKASPTQLVYFIDRDLFKIDLLVTSYFYDPTYLHFYKKNHPAFDVVPINRHQTNENHKIYWNRSKTGVVLSVGFDNGYGNYINIGFKA